MRALKEAKLVVPESTEDSSLSGFGANEWLVDEMYEKYQQDPKSVDQAWSAYFESDSFKGDSTGDAKPVKTGPSVNGMTIVTSGSDDVVEQITKQLNKLIDVVKVVDLSEAEHIERELMLIKVRAGLKEREDMKRMADIFRGRIIDVSDNTYTIELTGDGAKLDAFIKSLDQGSIIETVRTGASGIGRGNRVLRV
jgi:acetolactate synthase-1/3 small subunit